MKLLIIAPVWAALYPEYCSKPGSQSFRDARRIPTLTNEAVEKKPQLSYVATLLRHGSRTPAERYNCWVDYKPQWDCMLQSKIVPVMEGEESQPQFHSVTVYDANPAKNVLGGTCGRGHLLAEGAKQHQFLGKWFAEHYQTQPSPLVDPKTDLNSQIYFRSSDMQRTSLSANVFIDSFLQTAGLPRNQTLVMHTMDEEAEYIFPNSGVCPKLNIIKEEMFATPEFIELQKKHGEIRKNVSDVTGFQDIRPIWPGGFFDCLMPTVCGEQWGQLPPKLRPSFAEDASDANEMEADEVGKAAVDMANVMLDVVSQYAAFEYNYKDGYFSKAGIGRFMVEFKADIVRALMREVSQDHNSQETATILSNMIGKETLQDYYNYIVTNTGRMSLDTPFDAKRLSVYGAHDTTILSFLGSFGGNIIKTWPSFASQLTFELYTLKDKTQVFRLIYNGVVITDRIPGCDKATVASDLCDVSQFFKQTEWATPENAEKDCGKPTYGMDPFR